MERRTLRRDKLERVELQQKVENELRARHTVQQELTSVSTQLAESERYIHVHAQVHCTRMYKFVEHSITYITAHGVLLEYYILYCCLGVHPESSLLYVEGTTDS